MEALTALVAGLLGRLHGADRGRGVPGRLAVGGVAARCGGGLAAGRRGRRGGAVAAPDRVALRAGRVGGARRDGPAGLRGACRCWCSWPRAGCSRPRRAAGGCRADRPAAARPRLGGVRGRRAEQLPGPGQRRGGVRGGRARCAPGWRCWPCSGCRRWRPCARRRRRGSRCAAGRAGPPAFFWLPVLAVAVLTTDVPAGSAAHLWLGASAGASARDAGWCCRWAHRGGRWCTGRWRAPRRRLPSERPAPDRSWRAPSRPAAPAAARTGTRQTGRARVGRAARGAASPHGPPSRLVSSRSDAVPRAARPRWRGSRPPAPAHADPRRPTRCATPGEPECRDRGPGSRSRHAARRAPRRADRAPLPAGASPGLRRLRAGVARARRAARAHRGAQGRARPRRRDRGADPPRGPRAGDGAAPALRADPRPRARRQRPGARRARRHGDRDGVRARRVAR